MLVYHIFQGVAAGLLLGFSIGAPPGPVNATTAQQIGSGKSWLSGFGVGCGAMTADAIFLLLTYLGWMRIIAGNPSSTSWSYLAGGAIMTVFGVLTILGLRKKLVSSSSHIVKGRAYSFGNPKSHACYPFC
ncbi:MAG: LysE family transporter [Nitrososphaerota archaeon]|nr:LysE family transporter [Nitrososphaerota archaeon]